MNTINWTDKITELYYKKEILNKIYRLFIVLYLIGILVLFINHKRNGCDISETFCVMIICCFAVTLVWSIYEYKLSEDITNALGKYKEELRKKAEEESYSDCLRKSDLDEYIRERLKGK